MSARSLDRAEPEQRRLSGTLSSSNNTIHSSQTAPSPLSQEIFNNPTMNSNSPPNINNNNNNTAFLHSSNNSVNDSISTKETRASERKSSRVAAANMSLLRNGANNNNTNNTSHRSRMSSKMHKSASMAANNFHPKLITHQILALQCFQYFGQSLLLQINYVLWNVPTSIDRIFTDHYIHIWRREGVWDCIVMILSGILGAVGLALIVEKSKKCLDFTVTYFLLHFVLTCVYGGFPATLDWWVVHVLAVLIMVILGEYLCSLRELEMIPLLQF